MNKQEFLARLEQGLSGLPRREKAERVNFYSEMIDDRIEDGVPEEAVLQVGPVEEIVAQISGTDPAAVPRSRKPEPWQILLLVLGFPVWFPLLIGAGAVVFSLYVTLWAVAVSLWSVFGAFVGTSFGCLVIGTVFFCIYGSLKGFLIIAAALICMGLGIFSFFGCRELTKWVARFTKRSVLGVKNYFVRRVMGK